MRTRRHLVIAVDASPLTGLGHFFRSAALAAEASGRGWHVTLVAEDDALDWAIDYAITNGWRVMRSSLSADALKSQADELNLNTSTLLVDSYRATSTDIARFRALAGRTIVVDDLADRYLDADLVINQNLGAESLPYALAAGTRLLTGPRYALLRPEFAKHRPAGISQAATLPEIPRQILVLLGGTDVTRSAPALAEAAASVFHGADVTMIDVDAAVPTRSGNITRHPPLSSVATMMLQADLVISAAGTTLWELFCLARPVAAIAVADNQAQVYRILVNAGMVIGLGRAPIDQEVAAQVMSQAFARGPGLRQLADRAKDVVDGRGAARIMDLLGDYDG